MKKNVFLIVLIAVFSVALFPKEVVASKKVKSKVYNKLQTTAERMNKKGGFAFVGIAVSDPGRMDIGRTKAKMDAEQKMSQAKRDYVETTVHTFIEEIGVGKNSEINDVTRTVTDAVSANILKGARIVDLQMERTKANKKDGTLTYYVLLVISPGVTYQSIEDEIKGSDASLYQRYLDSEAQKIHDKQIKEFKQEFGVK